MQLNGKIALVTGGASGIGAAVCERFAKEGATVIVSDLNLEAAGRFAQSLKGASALQADVSNSQSVQAMFDAVKDQHGHLDILVNSAGIMEGAKGETERWNESIEKAAKAAQSGNPLADPFDFLPHVTDASWKAMIDVHMGGTFYCMRAAQPLMNAGSSIVNISSIGAVVGTPGIPHYSGAKAGICGLTRAIAAEFAPKGIRVNAVLPGPIETPMTETLSPTLVDIFISQIPMGRRGKAHEVANAVLFLASDEGSYFTGQQLSPNGGIWM